MVRESIPFIVVPAAIAAFLGVIGYWPAAAAFAALTLFMAYFFRDPERTPPDGPGLIVSSADGRVTRIEETKDHKLVSVFLSPLDVHINRSPITGTITNIDYVAGKKMPATSDKASLVNERNSLTITGDNIEIICTQIAGIVARRIVCWPSAGDKLQRGERFGLIKFSSRTDIKMPPHVEVSVKVGDRVKGGETIIACYTVNNPN
jgi:phosphatidylserine decarboxylase